MNTLNGLKKFVALIFATAMAAAFLTGCGHSTYFERGVYACYPRGAEDSEKTGFFVIEDENYGHTENGAYGGIGMAFKAAASIMVNQAVFADILGKSSTGKPDPQIIILKISR